MKPLKRGRLLHRVAALVLFAALVTVTVTGAGPAAGQTPRDAPLSSDATLSVLSLSDVDFGTFSAAGESYRSRVVAQTVSRTVVTATAAAPGAQVNITPADADGTTQAHEVDLGPGENEIIVHVQAPDGVTERTYTVVAPQGSTAPGAWNGFKDVSLADAEDLGSLQGVWSDGSRLRATFDASTSNTHSDRTTVRAFNLADADQGRVANRVSSQDVRVSDSGSRYDLNGLWSDGATLWVANNIADDGVYAHNLSSGAADADKDILIRIDGRRPANNHGFGLWSDGTTMWVSDEADCKLYAYDLDTGAPKPESTDWLLVGVGFLGRWRVGVVRGCWGCGLVCLGVLG